MLNTGFADKSASAAKAAPGIWVAKDDGIKQCEGKPSPEESMATAIAELKKAGIAFQQAKHFPSGQMVISICGGPSGHLNGFLIAPQDLAKAEAIGFKKWESQ